MAGNEPQRGGVGWRFRLRVLIVASLLVLPGMVLLVSGVAAWREAEEDLGPRHQLTEGVSSLVAAGDLAVILRDDARFSTIDTRGHEVSRFGVEDGPALVTLLLDSNLWRDGDFFFKPIGGQGVIVDLRNGSVASHELPNGFEVQGFHAGRAILRDASSLFWYEPGSAVESMDQIPVPPNSRALNGSVDLKAVDEKAFLVIAVSNNESFLEIWPRNGSSIASQGPLEGFHTRWHSGFSSSPIALTDEIVLMLRTDGMTEWLVAFDRDNLEMVWSIQLDSRPTYLFADDERWVVGVRAVDFSQTPTMESHRITFGSATGMVEGNHQFTQTRYVVASGGSVHPGPGGLWYYENRLVGFAAPGVSPTLFETASLIAGAALVLIGIVMPAWSVSRLKRTAGQGTIRCLNCGRRRLPNVPFCPKCGWRTPHEESTANASHEMHDEDKSRRE